MSLGTVILNWNQADDTIACVRSLLPLLGRGDSAWVVDNASRGDDVERIAAACPEARIVASDRNLGYGGGNNLAIRQALEAGSTEVLLLNNDARIGADDLSRLRRILRRRSDLAVVGPLLFDGDEPDKLLSAGGRDIARHVVTHQDRVPSDQGSERAPDRDQLAEVDYVPGTCALLAADALRQIGLLHEEYFFAGEMADFCRLARLAGRPSAVTAGARALHFTRRSSRHRRELYAYYVLRNRFLYVRRHHPEVRWRLNLEWTLRGARFWVEAFRRGDRRRARALRMACADGWLGRFGDRNRKLLGDRGLGDRAS